MLEIHSGADNGRCLRRRAQLRSPGCHLLSHGLQPCQRSLPRQLPPVDGPALYAHPAWVWQTQEYHTAGALRSCWRMQHTLC
jgi:hypothetical protein